MEQIRRIRILEKRWETNDAATFTLTPDDGCDLDYLPGQYLSLIRTIHGVEKRRAYSFSSCPGVDPHPAFTVKRIPNGEFSNWLLRDVQPGDVLQTGAPAGRFLLPDAAPKRLFFLAAGSGITPVFSHLKALLAASRFPDVPVVLFYANRSSVQTIFKPALDRWIVEYPGRFSCTYFFSQEKNAPHALFRHLNNALFEEQLLHIFGGPISRADRAGAHFFLCAPQALVRMARMTLRTLDFPEEQLHQEVFIPAVPPPVAVVDPTKTYQVMATGSDGQRVVFQIFGGETILNGALRQGIALPYTCKSGVCFTCLARCIRGRIELRFGDQNRTEGPGALVNTCIGYPLTGAVEIVYE